MNRQIVFIDDETLHIDYYLSALRGLGHESRHYKSPDSFLTALKSGERYSIYVTDLMMPSYGLYSERETQGGLLTGMCLVKDIRKIEIEAPVIVFSNLNIHTIISQVREELAATTNLFIVPKSDYPPREFADTLDAIINGNDPFQKRIGLLRRFWESLVLEPKVCGIGINIKKLGK
jgi:CheY-like chemotaxis protein